MLVRQSKGSKDRVVCLADDATSMVEDHLTRLWRALDSELELVFPGNDRPNRTYKIRLERKFSQFWAKMPGVGVLDARPTSHSPHHTFVAKRMNMWMSEG